MLELRRHLGQPLARGDRGAGRHPNVVAAYVADHRVARRGEPVANAGVEDLIAGGIVAVVQNQLARALQLRIDLRRPDRLGSHAGAPSRHWADSAKRRSSAGTARIPASPTASS